MNESREIPLVNSDQTATCDSCCYPYLAQFEWHLLADGSAARTQPCEGHPEPHLIRMEDEVADRHRCEIEWQSGMWDEDDETCYECPAEIGEPHTAGCPIAICLVTGEQRLSCTATHDCGADTWTGEFPGTAECEEFGWFSKWIETPQGNYWTRTTADDPEAVPDFDRLREEAFWDCALERWVLRGTT